MSEPTELTIPFRWDRDGLEDLYQVAGHLAAEMVRVGGMGDQLARVEIDVEDGKATWLQVYHPKSPANVMLAGIPL